MTRDTSIDDIARFPEENPNSVLRICSRGELLYANPSSRSLLDDWGVVVGDTVPDAVRAPIARAFDDDEERGFEYAYTNGRKDWLAITPVRDQQYVNVYGKDITKIRSVERLIANNSDAIRTPLIQLLGASDQLWTLRADGDTKQWEENLEQLRTAGREVLELLNKIEARL